MNSSEETKINRTKNKRLQSISVMQYMQMLTKNKVLEPMEASKIVSAFQKRDTKPLEEMLATTDFPESMWGIVAELRDCL